MNPTPWAWAYGCAWPPAWPWWAATWACPSCWWRSSRSSCWPGCASASPRWPCCTGCAHAGRTAAVAHDRRLLFWESFLGNFLFSICMLYGVQLTSALAAGVVMAAIPAAVALLSWLVLGERIRPPRGRWPSPARPGHRAAGAGARNGDGDAAAAAGSLLGLRAAAGRGAVRSLLRGHRQAAHRQRVAAAHQRAHQPVGPGAGHAASGCGRPGPSTSTRCARRPGACWSSTRWPPAWSRCGCG
jgi:hypothetical protein